MASLLRRSPALFRQCARLTVAQQNASRGYADMSFTFASPGDVYYHNAKVKQVDVPSFSGSFGILADHVPTLAVLKPGVVTVFEEDGTSKKIFVSSGSVTVNADSTVQILAEEAHPVERLDSQAIREGLSKAQSEATSGPSDKARAEAAIAVECYEAMLKALEH